MLALPHSFARLGLAAALIFVVVAGLDVRSSLRAQPAAPPRSTRDGVYTDAQAERGKGVFDVECRDCHTARMWGADWDGRSAADVYEYISGYMPEPAPGTLPPDQVRDVIAFLLKSNGLPDGEAELPADVAELKQIRMER